MVDVIAIRLHRAADPPPKPPSPPSLPLPHLCAELQVFLLQVVDPTLQLLLLTLKLTQAAQR